MVDLDISKENMLWNKYFNSIIFHGDFVRFCELNEDFIMDEAIEQLYIEWWYGDDYEVWYIEVPQWKFESVAESFYYWILDYPEYYIQRVKERPEHFYNLTKEDVIKTGLAK